MTTQRTRTLSHMSLPVNSRTFAARHAGECAACGEEFDVGTLVRYKNGYLVELQCPSPEELTEEELAEVRAARCPRCFCVHAGEC